MMQEMELVCFKIISAVGSARSAFMEAISETKLGHFDQAQALIDDGEAQRVKGHEIHFELLQRDSSGDSPDFSLLLLHAEDQLMSAELLKITAEELLAVYKRLPQAEIN